MQIEGQWWGCIWDEQAVVQVSEQVATCPDGAMVRRRQSCREDAERWCRAHERDVITRYRALNAYRAGVGTVRPEWLPYYRLWNADAAVMESGVTDPDEMVRLWREAYERGG